MDGTGAGRLRPPPRLLQALMPAPRRHSRCRRPPSPRLDDEAGGQTQLLLLVVVAALSSSSSAPGRRGRGRVLHWREDRCGVVAADASWRTARPESAHHEPGNVAHSILPAERRDRVVAAERKPTSTPRCSRPTRVLSGGCWIASSFREHSRPKRLTICLCGCCIRYSERTLCSQHSRQLPPEGHSQDGSPCKEPLETPPFNVKVNAPTGRGISPYGRRSRAALGCAFFFIQGWRGRADDQDAVSLLRRPCQEVPEEPLHEVHSLSSSMLSTKSKARTNVDEHDISSADEVAHTVRPHRICVAGLSWRAGGQCSVDLVRCYSSCRRQVSGSAPSRRTTEVPFHVTNPAGRMGQALHSERKTIRAGLPRCNPSATTFKRYRGPM